MAAVLAAQELLHIFRDGPRSQGADVGTACVAERSAAEPQALPGEAERRRILCTTNAVESLNSQVRMVLGNRGRFPQHDSVFKLSFLAIQNAKKQWRAPANWSSIVAHIDIHFEGRLPA